MITSGLDTGIGKAGFAWLVVSPAVRRWFVQRSVPTPLRVPVRIVRSLGRGLASVQLPGALATALGLPSPFVTVAEAGLRPASSALLWAAARSSVRRSVGAIG